MKTTRRTFLAGLAGTAFAGVAGQPLSAMAATGSDDLPAFLSADAGPDGFGVGLLDGQGHLLAQLPLPGRGHGAALSPDCRQAIVFARRPGLFAIVIDLHERRQVASFQPPADRHFFGHGCYSPDGRLVFATENDFRGERGVIGIYDTRRNFRRVGEFDSAGIGPHELVLNADGRTATIANGGILTHPDFPRRKLNLADMKPSLVTMDLQSGTIVHQAFLPPALHQLSIRHLTEAAPGEVWFGCQYQGPPTDEVPLVGVYRRDTDPGIEMLAMADNGYRRFRQYIGSVAATGDGQTVVTTSPRGNVAQLWDRERRIALLAEPLTDVCGAAGTADGFLLTDGAGRQHRLHGSGENPWHVDTAPGPLTGLAWDNHLTPVRRHPGTPA